MLAELINYIDINNADSTSADDKEWIFDQITSKYSVPELNKLVKEVVTAAKVLDSDPILESAVRRDESCILAVRSKPELYILNIVRCGFVAHGLLQSMMKVDDAVSIEVFVQNRLEGSVEVYRVDYEGKMIRELTLEKHQSAQLSVNEGSFLVARTLDGVDAGVHIVKAAVAKYYWVWNNKWIIY
jgi:hypothetical protein